VLTEASIRPLTGAALKFDASRLGLPLTGEKHTQHSFTAPSISSTLPPETKPIHRQDAGANGGGAASGRI